MKGEVEIKNEIKHQRMYKHNDIGEVEIENDKT
jgi:hypothetical protein